MRLAPLALLGLSLLSGVVGCAGYKLGPSNQTVARSQSIQIVPFVNETKEPRLSAAVNSSLRRNLQQDGTYRLDTHDTGDIIVRGTIADYDRSTVSVNPNDVLTPRDYEISIVVQVQAVDRATGKVLLNRKVSGRSYVRIGPDLVSAERQGIPLVADDLARQITDLLVDGDW